MLLQGQGEPFVVVNTTSLCMVIMAVKAVPPLALVKVCLACCGLTTPNLQGCLSNVRIIDGADRCSCQAGVESLKHCLLKAALMSAHT